jgi:hypothetical protein
MIVLFVAILHYYYQTMGASVITVFKRQMTFRFKILTMNTLNIFLKIFQPFIYHYMQR